MEGKRTLPSHVEHLNGISQKFLVIQTGDVAPK